MHRRENDLWRDGLDDFFAPFFGNSTSVMNTDIREEGKNYVMETELPGYDKKDVSIQLKNGYLTVTAKKEEVTERTQNYLRRERRSGTISRSFYVGDVSEKDVHAKFEKGVLEISFPKESQQGGEHHIEIL